MEPDFSLYGYSYRPLLLMETVKNVFNFEKGNGFYTDELVYDKKEKAHISSCPYIMIRLCRKRTVAMTAKSINRDIRRCHRILSASQLTRFIRKGEQLEDGKLKEIASKVE